VAQDLLFLGGLRAPLSESMQAYTCTVASKKNACAYFWPSLNFVRGFLYNPHMNLHCKTCIYYIIILNIFEISFR